MKIEITRLGASISAMGHRVAIEQGGENELKRRCLETLSHWSTPPDEILFLRPGALAEASPEVPGRQGAAGAQAALAAPAPAEAAPEPRPAPARRTGGASPPKGPGLAKAKDRR